MAIRTDEEFEDFVSDDLGWRRLELGTLHRELVQSGSDSKDSPLTRVLCRSHVAILYAHWEGFTKNVLEAYVNLLLKRKLYAHDLNDSLLVCHLQQLVRRIDSGDADATAKLVDFARGEDKQRFSIKSKTVIDAKSNLRFSVLDDNLARIGIDGGVFDTKATLIDRLLCDKRNEIAHGRNSFPDVESVIQLHEQVLEMLDDVRTIMLSALRTQGYRRPSTAVT